MTIETKPIAIFYEHPDWFRLLFAELDRRSTSYLQIAGCATSIRPRRD
mgnify:CR=1 FL=1